VTLKSLVLTSLLLVLNLSIEKVVGASFINNNVDSPVDLLEKAESILDTAPDSAKKLALSALNLSQISKDYMLTSKSLNIIGLTYFYARSIDSASYYFNNAYQIAKLNNVPAELANAMRYTGHIAYLKGELQKCDSLYSRAVSIYEKLNEKQLLAAAYNNKGMLLGRKGDLNESVSYYEQAMQAYLSIEDMKGATQTLINMGGIKEEQGYFNDALRMYFRGISLADSLKNEKLLGFLFNNVGVIYRNIEEFGTALSYFTKSLKIKQKLNDKAATGKTLGNIGLIHKNLQDYEASLSYFNQALKVFEELEDSYGEASTIYNLGNNYSLMGEENRAKDFYSRALTIANEKGYKGIKGNVLYRLGKLSLKKNQQYEGRQKIMQAFTLANQMGDKGLIKDTSFDLYLFEKGQNNFEQALEFHEHYEKAESSILNLEVAKDIMRQEARQQLARIELESKEQAIGYKEEIDEKSLLNDFLFVMIVTVSITLVLIYRLFVVSKGAEKDLNEKNTLIEQQYKKLHHQQSIIVDLNKNLEKQVANRTAEIKRKNEKLEEFAFINSHKLRKHLASIMGIIQILRDEEASAHVSMLLKNLDKSAQSMDLVIHEINAIITKLDEDRDFPDGI